MAALKSRLWDTGSYKLAQAYHDQRTTVRQLRGDTFEIVQCGSKHKVARTTCYRSQVGKRESQDISSSIIVGFVRDLGDWQLLHKRAVGFLQFKSIAIAKLSFFNISRCTTVATMEQIFVYERGRIFGPFRFLAMSDFANTSAHIPVSSAHFPKLQARLSRTLPNASFLQLALNSPSGDGNN